MYIRHLDTSLTSHDHQMADEVKDRCGKQHMMTSSAAAFMHVLAVETLCSSADPVRPLGH
jgi:hypothetical protein